MPVTNYYSISGEILGEEASGVRRDYLTDALGSVTATVTSAGAIENTYRYKPYGSQLAASGTGITPRFLWNGSTGSRTTNNIFSEFYNRARHYSCLLSFWISIDLLQNKFLYPYGYCYSNPILLSDPNGLDPSCCVKQTPIILKQNESHCISNDWIKCGAKEQGQFANQCDNWLKSMQSPVARGMLCMFSEWYINQRIKLCLRFGGEFGEDKKEYKGDEPWAGIYVVCREKDETFGCCGAYCCKSNMGSNPCWTACLITHELRHEYDCLHNSKEVRMVELCAYHEEVKCLFNQVKGICDWKSLHDKFPTWRDCHRKFINGESGCQPAY